MASDDRQRLTELMDYSLAQQQMTWDEVAQRAGKGGSVAQLRAVRTGRAPLSVKTKMAIERGLRWPPGTVDGIIANDERVVAAIRGGDSQSRPAAPSSPHDEDDGWTDEDEALYQALTELLRRQGLKPTPAIIQAMREEWEREQAERDVSDETG